MFSKSRLFRTCLLPPLGKTSQKMKIHCKRPMMCEDIVFSVLNFIWVLFSMIRKFTFWTKVSKVYGSWFLYLNYQSPVPMHIFRDETKRSKSHEAQISWVHIINLYCCLASLKTGAQQMSHSCSLVFHSPSCPFSPLWLLHLSLCRFNKQEKDCVTVTFSES